MRPTLAGSLSNTAAIVIPCSAKIGEVAIAPPSRPGPDQGDVVLSLGTKDPADLAEQGVDAVADAPLPNRPKLERSRRIWVALMLVYSEISWEEILSFPIFFACVSTWR